MQLFSRIDIGVRATLILSRAVQTENETMHVRDVEVGKGEREPDHAAHQDRAHRQLGDGVAAERARVPGLLVERIDLLGRQRHGPVALDVAGSRSRLLEKAHSLSATAECGIPLTRARPGPDSEERLLKGV
jgi:hypothetical protein